MTSDFSHTVLIEWKSGIEIVRLNLTGDPYRCGHRIETIERWPELENELIYQASVDQHVIRDSAHEIRLTYEKANNKSAAEHNEAWGHSLLQIDTKKRTARARWLDEKPDWSGRGRAILISEAMHATLEYETVARIKRQQNFRYTMETVYGGKCALTGETCTDLLDAAHIIEVNARGGNGTTNGILLRTDLHRLFDRNLLTIDESGRVILSAKLEVSQSYREALSGLQMRDELFKKIKHALKARQEIFN